MNELRLFPITRYSIKYLFTICKEALALLGDCVVYLQECLGFMVQGKLRWHHFIEHAHFIGLGALGISTILTMFAGMVIALQVANELTKQGAGNLVGALVAVAILRELAPIMTGFAVISMVGSSYCAELATMKIQKQVDALRVLHVHPTRYLVLPRLVAAITMLPMMTLLTAMAGIVGGMVVSYYLADLNPSIYMESVWQQIEVMDIVIPLIKASVFGLIIISICTTIGLKTEGGAKEVGISTTRAVATSFIAMALADYLLALVL
jgi:phospholipid/cholesterol/gamma-HCH transport system permease protein